MNNFFETLEAFFLGTVMTLGSFFTSIELQSESVTPTLPRPEPVAVVTNATSTAFILTQLDSTTISVRDFLNDPDVIYFEEDSSNSTESYYALGSYSPLFIGDTEANLDSIPASEERGYEIIYAGDSFSMFILMEPIHTVRQELEDDLARRLNLEKSELCKLKTEVFVAYSLREDLEKIDVGLPSCSNSHELQ